MPFKPGESGNPSGAKTEKRFLSALNKAIAQDDSKKLRKAADKLLDLAAEGEAWAIKELADRLDGRAVQIADVRITDDRAEELNDNDLNDIARRGRNGTAETQGGEKISSELH